MAEPSGWQYTNCARLDPAFGCPHDYPHDYTPPSFGLVNQNALRRNDEMTKPMPAPMQPEECKQVPRSSKAEEWGHLAQKPCRFCRAVGGVWFLMDNGPEGRDGLSPVRCDKCGRSWVAGTTST
jgi:hypothetical protein